MSRWRLPIGGAFLAACIGLWAGLSLHARHEAPSATDSPQAGGVRVPVGEASAPSAGDFDAGFGEAAPSADKIPERLPEFSLADRTGKTTSISAWRGKSLIINFWATWCAPCRHEMPLLQSLHEKWRGRNVEVIGIAVDFRDKVIAYADELKIAYPLLIGEQDALDVAAGLGVDSPVFPFTVFTDRYGRVVTLYVGELHEAQADLILSAVEKLDQKTWQVPAAREAIEQGLHALAASGKAHPKNDRG